MMLLLCRAPWDHRGALDLRREALRHRQKRRGRKEKREKGRRRAGSTGGEATHPTRRKEEVLTGEVPKKRTTEGGGQHSGRRHQTRWSSERKLTTASKPTHTSTSRSSLTKKEGLRFVRISGLRTFPVGQCSKKPYLPWASTARHPTGTSPGYSDYNSTLRTSTRLLKTWCEVD